VEGMAIMSAGWMGAGRMFPRYPCLELRGFHWAGMRGKKMFGWGKTEERIEKKGGGVAPPPPSFYGYLLVF